MPGRWVNASGVVILAGVFPVSGEDLLRREPIVFLYVDEI